jgi:replicative DNA helicase
MQKVYAEKSSVALAEKVLGRSLPYNIEAERAVLGSILLHDDQLGLIIEVLTSRDFYLPAHQLIYEAMVGIAERKQRVDLVTLQDELDKSEHLMAVGGSSYLVSLQEDIPVLGLIEQHSKIIKEKAVLRELISCATHIITNCYNQKEKDIEAILDEAERTIFQISQKKAQQSFVQLNIWLKKTFKHLSELKSNTKGITGIATGYRRLDELTSGFQKSDFVILAARPSMGKTALALSIAQHAARQGVCVGFFSLEMSAEQLTLRLLSAESRINHNKIRNAQVSSDEWVQLTSAAARLANMHLFIDDTAVQNIMEIRAKARKLKAEHNMQFLLVDYLQLLHGHRKYENRHQEVSEISRSLKALAKELGIPVLALSQLSRAVDSRVDKRPLLSDLRDSGAIEQDADVIMFLYRDAMYNKETENSHSAEVIIGKQRNGPTGIVHLHYENELTSFEDLDE